MLKAFDYGDDIALRPGESAFAAARRRQIAEGTAVRFGSRRTVVAFDSHPHPHAPAPALRRDRRAGDTRPPAAAHAGMDAGPKPAPDGWRARLARFEDWCARELNHDLAQNIGSARWYRGLATLVVLSAGALALSPRFVAVEAAPALDSDPQVASQVAAHTIAPLGAKPGPVRMGPGHRVSALPFVPERPSLQVVSMLRDGDDLAAMLQRAGLGTGDISRVNTLVSGAISPASIARDTRFDITLGRHLAPGGPRMLESLSFRARMDLDLAIERHGDSLALIRHPIAVDATPLRIEGTVGASLYLSARNAGAPLSAIQAYLRAIDSRISLDDLAPDDRFDMIVGYKRAAGGGREVGDLLYAGLIHDGKPRVRLMRWGKAGDMEPVPGSAAAAPVQSAGLALPVAGRITSLYGERRHPILGFVRMHAGVDIAAPWGTPIHAFQAGVVDFAGRHGGHGNFVRLDNGGGLGTGYAHMSRIAVSVGERVRAGEVIGYVGSTGLSTGPHVHFEVYRNGHTVNPLGMRFAPAAPSFDPRDRDAYKAQLARLMTIVPGAALAPLAPSAVAHGLAPTREIDRLAATRLN